MCKERILIDNCSKLCCLNDKMHLYKARYSNNVHHKANVRAQMDKIVNQSSVVSLYHLS